ncbi:MAG: hypothetical protein IPI46_00640 [Bacteroidetes bacterium]|nr:hypothetical protein [Bacteroidota bacterium]
MKKIFLMIICMQLHIALIKAQVVNDEPCSAIQIIPKLINDTLYTEADTIQLENQLSSGNPILKKWYKFTATSISHSVLVKRLAFTSPLSRIKLQVYHQNNCGIVDTMQVTFSGWKDGSYHEPIGLGENLIVGDVYYFSFSNEYLSSYPSPIPTTEDILFYGIYAMSNDHMDGALTMQHCQSYISNSFFSNESLANSCKPDLWYKFIALSDTADIYLKHGIPLATVTIKLFRKISNSNYVDVTSCISSTLGNQVRVLVDSLLTGSEYYVSIGSNIQFNSDYSRFSIRYGALKPSLSITTTGPTSICEKPSGISGNFLASPVNGGSSPTFFWYRANQINPLTTTLNNPVTLYDLQIGDSIYCVLKSSDSCYSIPDTSNAIIVSSTTQASKWYFDSDQDGYGTSSFQYACIQPSLFYALDSGDCAPTNPLIHQEFPFYLDNDGDTYGNGNLILVCAQNATTPPIGYGINFGDCDDNDSFIHQEFPFYLDNDGDNYGNGNLILLCAQNATTPPLGYGLNFGDCDDTNPLLHQLFPFYLDADGDAYGDTTQLLMYCALNANDAPTGYVKNGSDCNDNNPFIYPGTIDKAEYFIDSDPGVGQATAISINPTNADTLAFISGLSIPILSIGNHLIAIRTHTCNQKWSLFEQRGFQVTSFDIQTGPIVTGEYFIDTDPGLGNGLAFSLLPSDSVDQLFSLAIPSTIPPGTHAMGVRFKDSIGNWGLFEASFINVLPPPVPSHQIIAAEYFIDTDPGIGNAIALSVMPSDTLLQTFAIPVPSNLQDGHHLISIRVKNSINEWSLFDNRTFYVSKFDSIYNPIVAAEYFIDTDPGIGNATAISVVPADTILQNFAITVTNTLAFGNHSMNVRVMTLDSVWSLHESKIFNIKEPPTMLPGSGNAITLDGVNDYIQLPPILHGASQFTIDFWIKTTENGSSGTYWQKPTIIGNANPSAPDGDFGITTHNGQLGVWSGMCCGDQALQTTMAINDNQWHHIAAVNNGSILVLYVDGVLLPGSIPTNNGGIENITRPWRIGMNNSCCSGGSPHAGTVDEFRFWNTALSETQLRERMCRKITDSDSLYSNMSAYFNFDEQGLLNAIDGSSNSNSPTLQNGASRILSGAPIGNVSAYAYSGNTSSVGLSHPTRGDQITANITSGSASGLQVYCVTERPNTLTGIDTLLSNDAYYGVFAVNGNLAQVNTMYNYTGVPNITNEGLLNLYQRNANDSLSWTNSSASLNTINNTLSTSTLYRNEFMLGIIQPTYITFNLKAYLEGYYLGNGVMASVLFNQGEPNLISQTDTVDIILHNSISPYAIEYSTKGVLDTDGNASFILPASVQGNSYYITLKHRNSFETWSANPITMSAITNYNFTTSASQAYGDNLVEVDPGIFAIYCGDINQDQNADLLDASLLETSIANFDFGYFATDINGDGNVDLLDSPMLEVNMNGFIFSNYP